MAQERRSEFDLRQFVKPAMDALTDLCRARFQAFGTAGQASKIKVMPMLEMARLYRSGAFDPRIAAAKAA